MNEMIPENINMQFDYACESGNIILLKRLLDTEEYTNQQLVMGIRKAIGNNHIYLAKEILKKEIDVTINSNALLVFAVSFGPVEIIEMIIKKGADIKARNSCSLIEAIDFNQWDVVECFINHGADLHVNENYPFKTIAKNGPLNIIDLIIKKDIDTNEHKNMMFKHASENEKNIDKIKYLIKNYDLDINIILSHKDINENIKLWAIKYKNSNVLNEQLKNSLKSNNQQIKKRKI